MEPEEKPRTLTLSLIESVVTGHHQVPWQSISAKDLAEAIFSQMQILKFYLHHILPAESLQEHIQNRSTETWKMREVNTEGVTEGSMEDGWRGLLAKECTYDKIPKLSRLVKTDLDQVRATLCISEGAGVGIIIWTGMPHYRVYVRKLEEAQLAHLLVQHRDNHLDQVVAWSLLSELEIRVRTTKFEILNSTDEKAHRAIEISREVLGSYFRWIRQDISIR